MVLQFVENQRYNMDRVKNVVCNADIWKKKQKYYYLNRMKYIEGSLMKSSGKIFREHQKLLVRKKKYILR